MISRLINLRYEVLERVGEGAFFQVYKTRDKVMNRIVAVKTLQTAWIQEPGFTAALRQLSPEVTSLTHPNIARLYEVGEEEGAPFLVTEFVRGINLKERIRRIAPFTLAVAVDFAIGIGEALQHAHAAGIVHGDLRPHNVVISPEGALKVTDFGMGRILAVSSDVTASNLGRAVHYQAPEVAAGHSTSASSDLYALGVILFEMLTGSLPYPGETPLLIAMKHQNEPVPSPCNLNAGVPRSLEGIVMKAIQKRPEDRYRTAADILNDLKSVRDALRFGKPLSWSPFESAVGATSAGAGAVGTIGSVENGAATQGVSRRSEDTERAGGSKGFEAVPTGVARMSATAADDRISPYLKVALGTVLAIIITVGILGVAYWMAMFSKPPDQRFPDLIGMKWDSAKNAADLAHVTLNPHYEFDEKHDPDVIYRTDPDLSGRAVRPGREINVWVSKGSRMVWVPNVVGDLADSAEAKLKAAGLTLGEVSRSHDDNIPADGVIAQNPKAGKRVSRDVAVNLNVSDGPKEAPLTSADSNGNDGSQTDGNSGVDGANPPDNANPVVPDNGNPTIPDNTGTTPGNDATVNDDTPRRRQLTIRVYHAGPGDHRVRVEYDDTHGTHVPIDEVHREGDKIVQRIEIYGPQITVRVYYDDKTTPAQEKTIKIWGR